MCPSLLQPSHSVFPPAVHRQMYTHKCACARVLVCVERCAAHVRMLARTIAEAVHSWVCYFSCSAICHGVVLTGKLLIVTLKSTTLNSTKSTAVYCNSRVFQSLHSNITTHSANHVGQRIDSDGFFLLKLYCTHHNRVVAFSTSLMIIRPWCLLFSIHMVCVSYM